MLDELFAALDRRLRAIPSQRRALFILVFGILLIAALIALDQGLLRPFINSSLTPNADLPYFRDRTQTVLDGGWLYRDTKYGVESPPLITYLMLPPQILGGADIAYEIYFASFTVISAVVLYLGLRRFNDYRAFIAALLFLLMPYGTVESTFGIEDDAIAGLILLIGILLMLHERLRSSAFAIAIGAWTKVFSVLVYPILFIHSKSWRERGIHLTIIGVVSFLIALPFLLVVPNQFLQFPAYYFLGTEPSTGGTTGGMSFWDFLNMGGLPVPGVLVLAFVLAGILVSSWYAWKKQLGVWEGSLLILVVFMALYSRIALVYYMYPIALLLVWAAEDKRIVARLYLMYIPLVLSLLFSRGNLNNAPWLDYSWSWVAGLLLSLAGTAILLDTTRIVLKRRSFIQRSGESNPRIVD